MMFIKRIIISILEVSSEARQWCKSKRWQRKRELRCREDGTDELSIGSRSRSHDCKARVQPLADPASGTLRASLHRPGLRIFCLQSADDQAYRHHSIGTG